MNRTKERKGSRNVNIEIFYSEDKTLLMRTGHNKKGTKTPSQNYTRRKTEIVELCIDNNPSQFKQKQLQF